MEKLKQILDKEMCDKDDNRIYLYKMNDNWFAYERSAFYLFSINQSDAIFKIENPEEKNVILVTMLKSQVNEQKQSHLKILERSEDKMVLDCRVTCKGFLHWKEALMPSLKDVYFVDVINELNQSVCKL